MLAGLLLALPAGGATIERRLGVMGTSLQLEVTAGDRRRALDASEAAVRAIEHAEARLSTWAHGSEVARVNRAAVGEPTQVSYATAKDLGLALACAEATGGAFDPTVGALVEAWDLRGAGRVPGPAALERARMRVDYAQLGVTGALVTRRADVQVEEGGFGKGTSLDWAAEALRASGATDAWLDLGGQVLVLGARRTVSIAAPNDRELAALLLELSEGSASTSGNSERGRRVGGRLVGHLLDPRSGLPVAFVGSVTVVARSAGWADCLSTALFVVGPRAALEWVKGRPGVDVVVLEQTGQGLRARASAGLRGALRAAPGVPVTLEFDGDEGRE